LFKGSEKYAQLAAWLQHNKLLEEGIYKRYLVIVSKTKNKVPTVATEEHFLLLEFGFLLKIQHELILFSFNYESWKRQYTEDERGKAV